MWWMDLSWKNITANIQSLYFPAIILQQEATRCLMGVEVMEYNRK
jgi:hypothetical protein